VSLVLGLDVADARGCDAVVLGASMVARPVGKVMSGAELEELLSELNPTAIAIDSPPGWASNGRRRCERELTQRAINLFTTPDEATGTSNAFYAWMQVGFEMFRAAHGYPTLETFPYAVAVVINGQRIDGTRRQTRLAALAAVGIDTRELRTLDQIDAALCAYTAWAWVNGVSVSVGDESEGQITLPASALLDRYGKGKARGTPPVS
jgi:predicted nuclease with RNAse H fold